MVQVVQKTPSFLQNLGEGLAQGANSLLQNQLQQQLANRQAKEQQSNLNMALSKVQEIYANPNLSHEQKLIATHGALSGRPEVAKSLSEQLVKTQKQGQSQELLNQIFGPGASQ